jgi:branched-chain amino acid transport system substrate-binding protein
MINRLLLVLALCMAWALGFPGAGRAASPVTFIAAFNLTGPEAVLDMPSYQGAQLAVEQRNAAGGVLGRPLRLVAIDTASEPDSAAATVAAALQKNPDTVAGFGYSYSTFALEVGRVFQAAGLPFVTSGATAPDLPQQVGDQMFLAAYGDDAQAKVMAAFARDQLKLDHAALWIDEGFVYTRTVGAYFDTYFRQAGGSVDRQTYPADKRDFSALIAAFNAASPKPQAIYAASMPRTSVDLISQVRAAGITVPLLSGDGWDDPEIVDASRRLDVPNIYFTTHRFLDVNTPDMQAFIAGYKAKYGSAPPNAFAPLGFDTVNLLVDAIARAGSTEPARIRDALAATQGFPGVVGPISYAPGQRVPEKGVAVIGLNRGSLTPAWTWMPPALAQ